MYCKKCGKELEENVKFCPDCGSNTQINTQSITEEKNKKGKGIASMVLGIIAAYFGISVLGSATYYEDFGFAFAFGYVLIPLVLSIVANCLGVSERKKQKNGFNLTGLILAYVTYGLSFITFFMVA